jgi:transcriptional regulator with XRE-family HTH domain
MMTIGKFIKSRRIEREFTQIDLCNKAKITQSWLSQIEGDLKTPDPVMIRHILHRLGVHDFVLIYRNGDPLTYFKKFKTQ